MTDQERLSVVFDYMSTDLTLEQLAEKHQTTSKNIDLIVSRHWKSLTNIRETKILTNGSAKGQNHLDHKNGAYMALKTLGKASSINDDFLMKLSGEHDRLLTDNELQYCYNFVATGNNLTALESADLNKGLLTSQSDKNRNQYKLSCQLRGHYIRQKPNVAEYILKLKEEMYLPSLVDKGFIQKELLEILHHQKEQGVANKEALRTIELLGKTVGAFSDVIKIEEVDPSKALDYLESLSQADAHMITEEHQDMILPVQQ